MSVKTKICGYVFAGTLNILYFFKNLERFIILYIEMVRFCLSTTLYQTYLFE